MRGRKSEPAELKEAKGNPGRRALAKPGEVAEIPVLTGGAPDQLNADGKRIWAEIVPQLAHIRLVRDTDRSVLARYCDSLAEYWAVTKRLRDRRKGRGGGYTYEAEKIGGGTMLRLNPLFTVQDRLHRRLESLEDRLGLNPRARQEILYRLANAGMQGSLPLGGEAEQPPAPAAGSPVGFLGGLPDGCKPN
jgi:P27 family predicted phage terminase small subunit